MGTRVLLGQSKHLREGIGADVVLCWVSCTETSAVTLIRQCYLRCKIITFSEHCLQIKQMTQWWMYFYNQSMQSQYNCIRIDDLTSLLL